MRIPDPDLEVWLDGTLVPPADALIPIWDPAVQAGLGVFETLAVRLGRPVDLDEHLARLTRFAQRAGVTVPEPATLSRGIASVAAAIPGGYGWLEVVATRSGRCGVFGGRMDPAEEGRAVHAVLLPWRRNPRDVISGLKTLAYAQNVLGLEEAERRGAQEGIWLNVRGHLAEGCGSNVFVVSRRRLFTPGPREGILEGIVRGFAIRAARILEIPVHEGRVRLPRLVGADEAFLTSSSRGVRPLVKLDGRPIGTGRPGPVTARLAGEVARLRGI